MQKIIHEVRLQNKHIALLKLWNESLNPAYYKIVVVESGKVRNTLPTYDMISAIKQYIEISDYKITAKEVLLGFD